MSGLEKQLNSAVKFLESVRPLAEYEELERRQVTGLVSSFEKVARLTAAQAAGLLTIVDQANLSTESQTKLKTAVANKTQSAAETRRRSMQDFTLLPFFLTAKLWRYVMDDCTDRKHVLQLICEHALLLGLRCPTEGTIATILCLAYRKQLLGMSSKDKHTLLCSNKLVVKRVLGNVADGSIFLEALPQVWSELPRDLLKQAFPEEEKPAEALLPVQDLLALAQSIPLRISNADLTGETSASARSSEQGTHEQAMGTVMAACLRALSSGSFVSSSSQERTTPAPLAICDQEKPKDVLIHLLPKQSRTDPSGPTGDAKEKATEIPARDAAPEKKKNVGRETVQDFGEASSEMEMTDVPENTASHVDGRNAVVANVEGKTLGCSKNSKKKNLERELQELRQNLSAGSMETSAETPRKKPASCMRKPVASPQCLPQTSATKKRPAALVDVNTSKAQETREDKRQRLLCTIPANVKARYKNGCHKCRNRAFCTPSCWKARGYEL